MNYQMVKFVKLHEKRELIELNNSYTYRNDKKYKWLQRLCFFILGKIGAWNQEKTVKYTRITFKTDDFMKAIFTQKDELARWFNRDGIKILIGGEDFQKLMHSEMIRDSFRFHASYHFGCGKGRYQIYGLDATVIPWMKGILVLPKEEE